MIQKPPILDRLRYSYQFFKSGWRQFQLAKRTNNNAAIPFIWPDWRRNTPQWQLVNYEAYAQEGFNENSVIYSAIMYKVRSITSAPLRAYTGTLDDPELLPADHELQKLCQRPNAWQSWSEFQGLSEVYFNLAGNNYTVLMREADQTTPKSMFTLRPDRVWIVPSENKKQVIGYYYVPEGRSWNDGVPYLAQDVIHIKLPSPLDPLDGLGYGLSPISSMARSADVDNEVTRYLKLFFEKGAMQPGLLSFDTPMTPEDTSRARERWMEIYGGVDHWMAPAVLDQGGKYQRIALSFDEMGFEAIDQRNESRILGPFGVPPLLIGSRTGLQRGQYGIAYQQARQAFWEDTMTPELRWFEVDYQYYLQGDNGEFVMFDLSKVPALQPQLKDKVSAADRAFISNGISRGEYRGILRKELGFELDEALDELPEEDEPEPIETEDDDQDGMAEATEGEEEDKAINPLSNEQKDAFWQKTDAQARAHEADFEAAANRAFEKDKREILSRVNSAKKKSLELKQTVAWQEVLISVLEYVRMAGDNWRQEFLPVLEAMVIDRGNFLNAEFGMQFDVRNLLAEQWFRDYTLTFAQPILETTKREMSALFQQAMQEGWSIETMQNRLEQVFNQWMQGDLSTEDFAWFSERMPAFRREMIARTETIRASNAGSNALYRGWGVQQKEWLSTRDNRVRDTHLQADGQIVGINQMFQVGRDMLRYPGDPTASPGETINCRCTVVPIMME